MIFTKKKKKEAIEIPMDESPQRRLSGPLMRIAWVLALIMTFAQLYALFITPQDPFLLRSYHVAVVMILGFMHYPISKKLKSQKLSIVDILLILASIGLMIYVAADYDKIVLRSGVNPTTFDVIFGMVVIVSILELARRTSGITLPIIGLIFFLYALYGHKLPGLFGHPVYSFKRVVSFLFGVQGIYSEPIGVSATFVFMFILFGAMLNNSGGGEAIIDFAKAIAGGKRGGPAKVSILSSGLFGAISGSAVANVVVTGTFTIPMMKKTGYQSYFAGAVEAVASTGGQITPPVLGAAAFLIAEVLGVPYSTIVIATVIPAVLYYVTLFAVVDFRAGKRNLMGLPKSELPSVKQVVDQHGLLLLPIVILLIFLVGVGLSPMKSALYSAISVVIFALLNKNTRERVYPKNLLNSLAQAPKDLITVASTCSAAGIVVGTMSLTGIGHRFAVMLVDLSQGNILLALFLTMVVSIILGMGVPPVAAYAIAGSAIGPALVQLGIPPLSAHLFIFYFCAISVITPPVALASYAAAALAKADMWKVGITGFRMGITGFIIPYMFIYNPVLLAQGSPLAIVQAVVTALIGVISMAAFFEGWQKKHLGKGLRIILLAAAITLIVPGSYTDIIGLALVAVYAFLNYKDIGTLKPEEVSETLVNQTMELSETEMIEASSDGIESLSEDVTDATKVEESSVDNSELDE